jgi:hypothetical protein
MKLKGASEPYLHQTVRFFYMQILMTVIHAHTNLLLTVSSPGGGGFFFI